MLDADTRWAFQHADQILEGPTRNQIKYLQFLRVMTSSPSKHLPEYEGTIGGSSSNPQEAAARIPSAPLLPPPALRWGARRSRGVSSTPRKFLWPEAGRRAGEQDSPAPNVSLGPVRRKAAPGAEKAVWGAARDRGASRSGMRSRRRGMKPSLVEASSFNLNAVCGYLRGRKLKKHSEVAS